MAANDQYFTPRPDITPTIYAYRTYRDDSKLEEIHPGYLKIGYTERDVTERVAEQLETSRTPYKIVLRESALRSDGSSFTDKNVHTILKRKKHLQLSGDGGREWFRCSENDVLAAIEELRTGQRQDDARKSFTMRPEQARAVEQTAKYFEDARKDRPDKPPKFLWNAKMRFGKTFAAYELAKKMKLKKILVLTFKPAVESAWEEDLETHVDFKGWQFISNKTAQEGDLTIDQLYERTDKNKPVVAFGSFQDLLQRSDSGGVKPKNEFIHTTDWDLVIFDEYHFGAWRDSAQKLFDYNEDTAYDFDQEKYHEKEAGNALDESFLPITARQYLFLSGTPFRAINTGEFIEEQIFNWTYAEEQQAKADWDGPGENPYWMLPRVVMMVYKMPEEIRQIALKGEFNEFDLNAFFATEGSGRNARFKNEKSVQKWLDMIRGAYTPTMVDDLKLEKDRRPKMPYSDVDLLKNLQHTLWFLPSVASCFAMKNLLEQPHNTFYHDYKVIVCAGSKAGVGLAALPPVRQAMGDPLKTKTITLSCGKLTTGVTVAPWGGILMLRNLKSPETYFQAAFRVQSPWTYQDDEGKRHTLKENCYIFDFALDRALRQIADYSNQLGSPDVSPEIKVKEFVKFLPVLAYDGSAMKEIDPVEILDITTSGTSATLLARRWESALLVNVDNETLKRLLNDEAVLEALRKIEGFRNLNQDIETIINKSEAVKKTRKEGEKLTEKKKKELSDEEKKYKDLRKKIQDKLIKFATRIPIFMYLTDYREHTLKDIILRLEPKLFRKVTGLETEDFEKLVSLGVFNGNRMNDCVYKFKRYEDASLSYTGVETHVNDRNVGYFDTTETIEEYKRRK